MDETRAFLNPFVGGSGPMLTSQQAGDLRETVRLAAISGLDPESIAAKLIRAYGLIEAATAAPVPPSISREAS